MIDVFAAGCVTPVLTGRRVAERLVPEMSFRTGYKSSTRSSAVLFPGVITCLSVLLLILASPAQAQEPTPAFPNHTAQQIADVASYGTLGAEMTLEVIDAIHCPDKGHCLEQVMINHLIVYAVQGILSVAIGRARPCAPACGIDDPYRSLPSGHAGHAGAGVWGDHLGWKLGLSIATSGLRVAANKHHISDVAAGWSLGFGTTYIWK